MTTSLFIKSHKRDFPWLEWCKKSIELNCSGFHEIVLCLPEGESFSWPGAKIVHVRETFNPYLFQQAVKLNSDVFCSGDFITFQDSDTIFDRKVTPEDFMVNGKPYWIIRPYGEARSDQQVWRKPTSDFIGQDFEYEAMARHPFTVPRIALQKIRGFCQFKHGISLDEYIHSKEVKGVLTALTFSEWNAMGAFAFHHMKNDFHWIDSSKEEPPPACCYQGHTWDGEKRMHQDLAKFREILDGSTPLVGHSAPEELNESPPVLTEDQAIEALLARMSDSKSKAKILSELTKRSPKFKGAHFKKKKAKA